MPGPGDVSRLPALRGFVGRAEDLAFLSAELRPGSLVTLRGPGGMGKTSLAVFWARSAPSAVFVDLSAESDEAGLRAAFGRALELPAAASLDVLRAQLSARGETVVVVDNAETVLGPAAALLGPELPAAVLVTSREPLGVARERVRVLGPIGLPADASPEVVAASDAFLLLAEAIRRRRGQWTPAPDEVRAAGELCRRLDGIPLALELAAARLGTLDLRDMLGRLEEGVAALGTGPRDANARHRSLEAAIEGSLRTLDAEEREVLDACSLFVAPFDVPSVQALVGRGAAVHLETLHDKSLLTATDLSGRRRLSLYDTVRQVVAAALPPARRQEWVGPLIAHFAAAGAAAEAALDGADAAEAWARLDELAPHLFSAVELALERRRAAEGALAARLVRALAPAAQVGGRGERLLSVIERVLELLPGLPARERTLLLERRAQTLYLLGRREEGARASDEAIAAARRLRDKALEARLRTSQARMRLSPTEEAIEELTALLPFVTEHGEPRDRGLLTNELAGRHSERGEHDRAEQLFRESLAAFTEAEDVRSQAVTACQLAILAIERDRLGEARAALEDAEALAVRARGWNVDAMIDQVRAHLFHAEGALAEAEAGYAVVETRYERMGARLMRAIFRGYRGIVLREAGRVRDAERELARATSDLAALGETHHRALFHAHLAALARSEGRDAVADEELARGRQAFAGSGASGIALAFALVEAERSIRTARTLAAEHDPRGAEAARRQAQRTIDEAVGASAEVGLDGRIAERIARRGLAQSGAAPLTHRIAPPPALASTPAVGAALVLHEGGRWFQLRGEERVGLASQALLRRLVVALAEARLARPGEPLSAGELLAAGWPGEKMRDDSGKNRLQVALSGLRKLGLKDVLQREGDGYRLDPEVALEIRRGPL